jgi:predicted  nucleic acid-binding Zn-ribbon protein
MASYLDLIRDIQKLDENLDGLEEEIGRLPKYVAEIEAKLKDHKDQLAVEKRALEQNETDRRRLEGEVALAQEKSTRLEQQIAEVKTNDQYRALRNEISFARKEIKNAEDLILERMEETESLTEKVEAAEKALAEESVGVAAEVAAVEKVVDGDRQKMAAAKADRDAVAAKVPQRLLRAYERVRRKLGSRAVSPVEANRCSSCHMVQRPHLLQELRLISQDEVITCEFCNCILYYPVAEAVVTEDPAGEQQ